MKRVINQKNQNILVANLKIASSLKNRLIGLMGQKSLADGEGLLIRRSGNSIHTFFMKFPIDLIFINHQGKVKHLVRDLKPWRMVIAPLLLPTDCLELPAGTIQKTDTRIGDRLLVEA